MFLKEGHFGRKCPFVPIRTKVSPPLQGGTTKHDSDKTITILLCLRRLNFKLSLKNQYSNKRIMIARYTIFIRICLSQIFHFTFSIFNLLYRAPHLTKAVRCVIINWINILKREYQLCIGLKKSQTSL